MLFRVKFVDRKTQKAEEFDYESLFDAIRVAKETSVGELGMYVEAIPDQLFNDEFLYLLTRGTIETDYVSIQLFKVNEHGEESPVYGTVGL